MKYKLANMFILNEAGVDYANGHWPYRRSMTTRAYTLRRNGSI